MLKNTGSCYGEKGLFSLGQQASDWREAFSVSPYKR